MSPSPSWITAPQWQIPPSSRGLPGHLAEAENAALHAPHRREVGPYRRLALAAIYAHQDRLEDARAAVAKILEIREDMSLDVMRRFWQHANPQFTDTFLADLRKAGLPA